MAKKYYAYHVPSTGAEGICDNWNECKEIVHGVKASYKSFPTYKEAEEWLDIIVNGSTKKISENKSSTNKNRKIYACFYVNENYGETFSTWEECQKAVKIKKCRYQSFKTINEAQEWLNSGAEYIKKDDIKKNLPDGIYFDAGTGRGIGVEVRVTFKDGNSVLNKYLSEDKINEFGNYLMPFGSSNNFGELTGINFALEIALKEGILNIYGDSALVIDYWSKGFIKKDNVNSETYELALKVKNKREFFESIGGKVSHISGDFNPADLGFHK